MSFDVSKTSSIDCLSDLKIEINNNVTITTVCEDIRLDLPTTMTLTFAGTGPLSGPEDTELDSILSTFSCPTPTNSDPEVDDDSGPDSNILWSSQKVTDDFVDLASVQTITGLKEFKAGGGTGAITDYDIEIGDADATPTYGVCRIGDSIFGRTSFISAGLDLDGAILIRNVGGAETGQIEYCFVDSTNNIRFALPNPGVGNATYNPRSMLHAGPAPFDDDAVTVGYWQTNNSIFNNLACNTAVSGADVGVQNDLEVEGDIFTNSIISHGSGENIVLAPQGVGNVEIGNFEFDADQTVGAGQDNYVLKYDNGIGSISLELPFTWPFSGTSGARTWTVHPNDPSADYSTIQAAINAATNQDTILVGAGDYPEVINCTKRLTIVSTGVTSVIDTANGGPFSSRINPALTAGQAAITTATNKSVWHGFTVHPTFNGSGTVSAVRMEGPGSDFSDCQVSLVASGATTGPFYGVEYVASVGQGSLNRCQINVIDGAGTARGLYVGTAAGNRLRVYGCRFFDGTGISSDIEVAGGHLYIFDSDCEGDLTDSGAVDLYVDATTRVLGTRTTPGAPTIEGVTPNGVVWYDTTTSKLRAREGGTDKDVIAEKTFRIPHTWAISGEISVPSGDTDFIIPFFVSLPAGQTAALVKARHRINSGTSATVKLQKNGLDVTGFTGISVTTTDSTTDPTDVAIADDDDIALIVTGVSGTPTNLTFTIFIEYTQ